MGIIDPERSLAGDSLADLLSGKSAGLPEPTPRQTLARLWQVGSAIFAGTDWKSSIRRLGFIRADYQRQRRDSNVDAFDHTLHAFVVRLGLGAMGAVP